jgi:4-hydroxy-2-oxoheptanedioate aldolase
VSHDQAVPDRQLLNRYVLNRGDLRRRLAAGEATYGTFVGAATPITAEVCAAAGVDWVLLDLEHGAGGEEQARDVVPAAASYRVPTVVRVESTDRIRAGRLLDVGATGIMFPRVDSAAQARECVRHLRYPPAGDRGVATYNRSDTDVLGIVQIETLPALNAVDEIAALDGVDVLFVGPRDLSHALDVPGQTQAPAYRAALDRVIAAAKANGKAAGLLVPDGAAAALMTAAGWQFIAIGSDTTLLAAAVTTELRRAGTTA